MKSPPRHPAKFSDSILEVIKGYLKNGMKLLDPFAGTGKIARLKDYFPDLHVTCNELEEEWCYGEYLVDEWHVGDAQFMNWASDGYFDAIVTSPTYGNRMADHHDARDGSKRNTYTHCLGKQLKDGNTGKMQWGKKYRDKHIAIYSEFFRVLSFGGILIINVSDHIRKGKQVPVVTWHVQALKTTGFMFIEDVEVETKRLREGENHDKRVACEHVLVFRKNTEILPKTGLYSWI